MQEALQAQLDLTSRPPLGVCEAWDVVRWWEPTSPYKAHGDPQGLADASVGISRTPGQSAEVKHSLCTWRGKPVRFGEKVLLVMVTGWRPPQADAGSLGKGLSSLGAVPGPRPWGGSASSLHLTGSLQVARYDLEVQGAKPT